MSKQMMGKTEGSAGHATLGRQAEKQIPTSAGQGTPETAW